MPLDKEKKPSRYSFVKKVLVVLGILLPVLLFAPLLFTHGAVDTLKFDEPTQHLFVAIFGVGVITLLAAVVSFYYSSNKFLQGVSVVIAVASIIISLIFASFVYAPQFSRSGDVPPQLILTGSNGNAPAVALVFYTEKPTANTIVFDNRTIAEAMPSQQHWFNLDVKPETNYTYSINGQPPVHFSMPALGKLRFAAAGDSHSGGAGGTNNPLLTLLLGSSGVGNSREDLTAKMYGIMKSDGYDVIFHLGDATQYGFSDAHWKDAFRLAAPTTGSIPIEYLPGNHDTMFGGLRLYETYLCQNGRCGNTGLMKHIRNGNVDIITLDLEWGLQLYTSEQQQWLEKELASVPHDHWLIVMSHTFYYASGLDMEGWTWYDNKDTIPALVPLFEKYHVDLVLSGHTHDAEVLKQNGVTYGIIGTFGGILTPERTYVSPASIWYKTGVYGFADVNINGSNATLTMRDCNNTVLYQTDLQKNN
jgi:predicted phosphodiesterase